MTVTPIKTPRITPQAYTLEALLDETLPDVPDGSVLAVTSKIVSLCEGAVVPMEGRDKHELVRQEADLYLENNESKYGIKFTIKHHTLIPTAGIDESNAGDVHVLWPRNPQESANKVREYLARRFGHQNIGVVITDSTSRPMRLGVSGISLAYSGFKPLRDYRGEPDLFGRPFVSSRADVADGLAAAAVLVMGEGAESTPLVLMCDLPFIEFVSHSPTDEELGSMRVSLEDDMFAPFLQKVPWVPGKSGRD